MKYTLDTQAARQANTTGRITETGAYTGIFTKAKKVVSQKGVIGIEFSFKDEFDNSADYLTVWTVSKDGNQTYGYKQLMALMTCLRLNEIASQSGLVEEYDSVAKQAINVSAEVYPALMNKQIGVLLQAEEYEKGTGEIGQRMNLFGFFDAASRLTAVEILDKKTSPEVLDKMLGSMQPIKKLKNTKQAGVQVNSSNFDNEIPSWV